MPDILQIVLQTHWSQILANLGQMFAAVGALMTAVVGVITYRRAKRREAAQWMHEIFQRFQLGPEFDEAKQIFDFQYHDVVKPLLAALVASGNAAILRSEWKACHLIDRLLNYLEHLYTFLMQVTRRGVIAMLILGTGLIYLRNQSGARFVVISCILIMSALLVLHARRNMNTFYYMARFAWINHIPQI